MKSILKIILLLGFLIASNILASRVVGGPFKNLTFWRHWVVKNGVASEKITFYSTDSNDVKLSVKLVRLNSDYPKDDSTIMILWDSILLQKKNLKTLDFPLIKIEDSSRVYLSITNVTPKDTSVREYNLENYFPLEEIHQDGNYISFGKNVSIHLIFKTDSLVFDANKEYLIDLYIKCTPKAEEKFQDKKIHFVTHEKAQKFLGTERKYLKYLEKTPIVLEVNNSSNEALIMGTSNFGNTIDPIGGKYKKYSKVQLRMLLPDIKERKVIGAAFLIQESEGNISFNQLNILTR